MENELQPDPTKQAQRSTKSFLVAKQKNYIILR